MSSRPEPSRPPRTRTIQVDYIARVEGEGALDVRIEAGEVADVKLRIFEPPRFFEGLLRGRRFTEAPDITARICGICPVAYQMSSCQAMEDACGMTLPQPILDLRRLLYCGEWIASHTLHIYMLHAPDFMKVEGAVEIAREHPDIVKRGLRLKKIGNDIMALLGGRAINPINVRVGGFYKTPTKQQVNAQLKDLQWALDAAIQTVRWVANFDFPDLEVDYEFVALRNGVNYPMNHGRLVSNRGLDIEAKSYDEHFEETHVPYCTALHARRIGGGSYFVGPMARLAHNADLLTPHARQLADEVGLALPCRNPFKSIIVRALEVVVACEEAIRLVEDYTEPDDTFITLQPTNATGYAITEAPRGILYHRYKINTSGEILDAKLVPPTSQNQPTIEDDLRRALVGHAGLDDDELGWRCERTIRNYDPCISCATHFLKMNVERT